MLDGLTLIHRAFPRKPRGPLELDAGGGPGLSPGDLTRGVAGSLPGPLPTHCFPHVTAAAMASAHWASLLDADSGETPRGPGRLAAARGRSGTRG